MKAPTAPGRKIEEETLTWLNQGFYSFWLNM